MNKNKSKQLISRPLDVDEQTWNDWMTLRSAKKAPVTETVLTNARREAAKARMSLDSFLQVWCLRGSQGLQAEWLKPNERQQSIGSPQSMEFARLDYRQGVIENDLLP